MRFEYADDRMPVAMIKSGITYYLTYDQVGSLRVVADASGNVVKRIDYDSFGNIISDTNPGFEIPFGFAGGLHDREARLVKFGFRDYDPSTGRWTAKDPIGFAGGDIDLYGDVGNNPVNFVDPLGLQNSVPDKGQFGPVTNALWDFWKNYREMREARTIGADQFFHCMAHCQATKEGPVGYGLSTVVGEGRELWDEYIKRDSRSVCDKDRAANERGREGDKNKSCKEICKPLKPQRWNPNYTGWQQYE